MSNSISRKFKKIARRLSAAAIVGLAIALPAASFAADTVQIEGALGVANVTAGDNKYQDSVNASYDQVVKYQVYYHNREDANSGKIAQNLNVKINMPNQPGKVQTTTAKISASNSNVVTDSATVNLTRDDAYLQYIPGSAVWKHNIGTNQNLNIVETKVSDAVVTDGQGLTLENEKPCYNFAATVTVLARVTVPGVKVTKQVQKADQTGAWTTSNVAEPGEKLKYMISYQNTGNTTQNQVVLRDNLPPRMTLVPGTTVLTDFSHPSGVKVQDTVTQGGVNAGNFSPGANAFLVFQVQIPTADQLACGKTEFRNVGVVRPQGMNEYYNTATTVVNKECKEVPKQPKYACDLLEVKKLQGREIEAKLSYTAEEGATLKTVSYDFGDDTTSLLTDKTTVKHTYAKDGTYQVTAKLTFRVNGSDVGNVSSQSCSKVVTYTTPPTTPPATPPATKGVTTELPNTGAGEVLGLFAGVSAAGAAGHYALSARRARRES